MHKCLIYILWITNLLPMQQINKLSLLTDNERQFILASKNERTKTRFKNPSILRKRIKEKSKNLFLSIPELVDDILWLYNFNIEDISSEIQDNALEFPDRRVAYTIPILSDIPLVKAYEKSLQIPSNVSIVPEISNNPLAVSDKVLELMLFAYSLAGYGQGELNTDFSRCYSKFAEFLRNADVKTLFLLTVSRLFSNSPEEYKHITEQLYATLKKMDDIRIELEMASESSEQNKYEKEKIELSKFLENSGLDIQKFFHSRLLKGQLYACLELLKRLTENERKVAFEILVSEKGMLRRNDIIEKTSLDKRYVTRYCNKLVNKGILIELDKYYIWNESIIQQFMIFPPAP